MAKMPGASFHGSDRALNRGFDWAVRQALAYVVDDAPIGPCYEAALPSRQAFCMRDVSHQAMGAQVLGRGDCNSTMLQAFARGINETRDFCSFWEICFDGTPCPVDYTNDKDFWYNLPANFDVMDACWRMFNWTGDGKYLFTPDMENFHNTSLHDYIRRWDRDRDGIPDRRVSDGRRGIASYDESDIRQDYTVAADLIATLYAAYRARAEALSLKGEAEASGIMTRKAEELQALFNEQWWNSESNCFESLRFGDSRYGGAQEFPNPMAPLYYGIISSKEKQQGQLAVMKRLAYSSQIEGLSHVPEILWRYQEDEAAQEHWLRLTSPDCPRREYPEASFCAVGAIAGGYMGILPSAPERSLRTRSAILGDGWASLDYVPLWGGYIHLLHEGRRASTIENFTGGPLTWTCVFEKGNPVTVQVAAGEAKRVAL